MLVTLKGQKVKYKLPSIFPPLKEALYAFTLFKTSINARSWLGSASLKCMETADLPRSVKDKVSRDSRL